MNSIILLAVTVCVLLLAYRYYAAFIGAKVLMLNDQKETPAITYNDGRDYVPTNKLVVFGHHFAAIAGAGPLIGPVLAAQYGWGPSFLWILFGSVFAGAVHDMVVLFGSMQYKGQSISTIARNEVGPVTGAITSVVIFFIIMITLAGAGTTVVNALFNNPWSVFSIVMTIPIAMLVGIYIFHLRPGTVILGSVFGVILVCASVFAGPYVAASKLATWFTFDKNTLSIMLPTYGFVVAVLPVWLLLTPRGYLSTYMKVGVIFILAIGFLFAAPIIKMPFTTEFINGNGPIIPGSCWPYVFITVGCGAISGFHALISSGTTPKLVEKESHIPVIGFGAMLLEAFIAVMALLAVVTLSPGDYFAINASAEAFAKLNINVVELPALSQLIGLDVAHRPGGAISLAVGMASIFTGTSAWFQGTMKYWFQFILMFEALFILTLIDAGTRVARYMLQGIIGVAYPKVQDSSWLPGIALSSALVSLIWGYLLYTGDISSLWPLFGSTNLALASLALAIGTTILLRVCNKKIYALVTILPFLFVFVTAIAACVLNAKMFFAKTQVLNAWISIALAIMVVIVVVDNIRKWLSLLKTKETIECCCPANV